MAAIDSFTFGRALGLGFLLSVVSPKSLILCLGAGLAIAKASLSTGRHTVAVLVFAVIAASTVIAPIVGSLSARQTLVGPLNQL